MRTALGTCLLFFLLCFASTAGAKTVAITTHASCAIVGMTPEQASYLALQRARAAAIEQATGVHIVSSSLVTDGKLAADFIKSFSRGYVIKEKVRWLPLAQYQRTPDSPPVPEYGVQLAATVFVPDKPAPSLGLRASMNHTLFRSGELCTLTVSTRNPARIGVFNFTADGRVTMLFPSGNREVATKGKGASISLPTAESGMELTMVTLPDHRQDAEGFFVAALPVAQKARWLEAFVPGRYMDVTEFFSQYARLSVYSEEVVLSYEVIAGEK